MEETRHFQESSPSSITQNLTPPQQVMATHEVCYPGTLVRDPVAKLLLEAGTRGTFRLELTKNSSLPEVKQIVYTKQFLHSEPFRESSVFVGKI